MLTRIPPASARLCQGNGREFPKLPRSMQFFKPQGCGLIDPFQVARLRFDRSTQAWRTSHKCELHRRRVLSKYADFVQKPLQVLQGAGWWPMSSLSRSTQPEAADLYGISPRTIAYAKRAIRDGTSALTAALETGKISVWGAAWLADHADAAVQHWVVAEGRIEMRRRLRLARRDPEAALRAARPTGPNDEVPPPLLSR